MKNIAFIVLLLSLTSFSQTRGIKIGYIDMEYILEKVPEYAEASNQLEQKAIKWKQEIEVKKNEIKDLKDKLETEKVLLTKELIEERSEEISFLEAELLDYQEKRFGARGDLIIQKTVLVKPIQDQVFTAIQDIAEQKKYDFILDKSSDLTILFASQRYDISDLVIRTLDRAKKREQLSNKQLKALEAADAKEDLEDNPAMNERQSKLDERKAAREKLIEDKKAAREKILEDRRKAIEEKQKNAEEKKNGTVIETDESGKKTETNKEAANGENKTEVNTENLTPAEKRDYK